MERVPGVPLGMEHVTDWTGSNMIDVAYPSAVEISQSLRHAGHERHGDPEDGAGEDASAKSDKSEDEEAAWLRSVREADDGPVAQVKGLQSGKLVMDLRQLREEPTGSPARC